MVTIFHKVRCYRTICVLRSYFCEKTFIHGFVWKDTHQNITSDILGW